jgi:hypothetical protein
MNITFIRSLDRFREEAVMTIAHRTLSSAFWGARVVQTPDAHRSRTQETGHSLPQSHIPSEPLTCAPWEGLYMEPTETSEPSAEAAFPTAAELDRFLASLMYGE